MPYAGWDRLGKGGALINIKALARVICNIPIKKRVCHEYMIHSFFYMFSLIIPSLSVCDISEQIE